MAAARPLPASQRAKRTSAESKARTPRHAALADRRAVSRRAMRRRPRLLVVTSIALVGGSLFAVAAGQALVAAHQVELDQAQKQLSSAVARNQNLEFTLSKLEAPARIVAIAEDRYGMVVPASVLYLAPVNPGPNVTAAAKRPSR
jgi:cell division protein FtsB